MKKKLFDIRDLITSIKIRIKLVHTYIYCVVNLKWEPQLDNEVLKTHIMGSAVIHIFVNLIHIKQGPNLRQSLKLKNPKHMMYDMKRKRLISPTINLYVAVLHQCVVEDLDRLITSLIM